MNPISYWVGQARRIRQLEAQLENHRSLATAHAEELESLLREREALRPLLQSAHACININPKAGQSKVKAAIDVLGGWTWKK